ncbi:MAG: terpene cyclase/mutase family protein [Kiritimatiellae bacterium]|nr:terpene cyclase/mutase family protein [Kiritimatiellia bacterium]
MNIRVFAPVLMATFASAILTIGGAGCRRNTGATPLGSVSNAPAAVTQADTLSPAQASLNRGLNWLKTQQQTNGVWSNPSFPALSALPLWAISVAARPEDGDAANRAIAYIVSCEQPDGGIYVPVPGRKGGGLSIYNTAICMTALHYAKRPELAPLIRKARSHVAGSQHLGGDEYYGGFGYDKATKRPYTDLMNTHWALSAMRVTQDAEDSRPAGEARVDADWDAALAYVTKLQNTAEGSDADSAGGFVYNPNNPQGNLGTNAAGRVFLRSYGSITYAGLLSLIYAQVGRDDPRVVSAVDYASRHWTLEENPGMGRQGLFYYYNIMARALSLTGLPAIPKADGSGEIAWRDELIARIVAEQQPDGSWVNSDNRFWEGDPVLSTSYALLTLEYALGMMK